MNAFSPARAHTILSGMFLSGIAMLCAVAPSGAQEAQAPARPVVLPMTPGAKTTQQPAAAGTAAPRTPRPRVIQVGPATQADAAKAGGGGRMPAGSPSDYTFCNMTSYAVTVAVAFRHGGLMVSRGWWPIAAGECKDVIRGPLLQPAYYTFARSSFAHTGPMRTWGGGTSFCTGKGEFQATAAGDGQCGPGYEPQGFARIDTNGKENWLTVLSESSALRNLDMARTAGLQRLLHDLGLFDGAIDGVAGPKFAEALARARTQLKITSAAQDAAYASLLAEAGRIQAGSGITLCNRTDRIIDTAIGRDTQERLQSRGWYRLQPQQCEKVVRERLTEPQVFAYAIEYAPAEGQEAQTWPGTKQFCTRDAPFEFEDAANCTGKGAQPTGFFAIDTAGAPGITFDFQPSSEAAPTP